MWNLKTFDELTTRQLFNIYKARTDVFVVEQNCAYPEVDEDDLTALHLFQDNSGALLAYCRLMDQPTQVRIGRVLVTQDHRGRGLGRDLVAQAIAVCREQFPDKPIYAHAQAHLQDFYASFGFQATSDVHLEDDIPHIGMLLEN